MPRTKAQHTTTIEPTNNLGRLFAALRYAERKTLRDMAEELEVTPATIMRLELGHVPDGQTTKKLLIWLFEEHEVKQ